MAGRKKQAWGHELLGIPKPACKKYPQCGVHDGSCMKAHLESGHKTCGYPWKPKKKPTKKQLEENHQWAAGQAQILARAHNDKVLGIGTLKRFRGHLWIKRDVSHHAKNLEAHADVMKELGRIKAYRIVKGGKFGAELWTR